MSLPRIFILFLLPVGLILIYIGLSRIGDRKESPLCANTLSCTKDLSGSINPAKKEGEYMGKKIHVPIPHATPPIKDVLGAAKNMDKKILVDLSKQKLYAYTDNKLTYTFAISSGKHNPTPIGKFYIWIKLRATDMEGGDKSLDTYYNLPNVPYTMYFYNDSLGKWLGYGIHGAYWESEFGMPNSQGCIILSVENAEKLYTWADPPTKGDQTPTTPKKLGTEVIVFGKAPL